MNLPGHSSLFQKLKSRKCVYDLLIAVLALTGGVGSALRAYKGAVISNAGKSDLDFIAAVIFICGGFLIAVLAFWRFLIEWQKAETEETARDLEGCLNVLQTILLGTINDEDANPGLRLTIHKPVEDGEKLQQIIEYVGDRRAGSGQAGRVFSAHCGVIGAALREMDGSIGSWNGDDYEALIATLVADWGYSQESARALNTDSRSWIAVPLIQTCYCGFEDVVAVVYLDAIVSGFFTEDRAIIIGDAARGLARFIASRYK